MRRAIEEAQTQLGAEGWKDADLRVVMLASIGYIADKVEAKRGSYTWLLPTGILVGGILGGMVTKILV